MFYSGHGVPGRRDGRGYLLPVNANADTVEINGYPIDVLYENLAKLETKSVSVFIDACFSGASHRGMLIRAASPVFIKPKPAEDLKGLTVLTAASGTELASWDEKAKHGHFTHHLLNGLYGDADDDGNGRVTLAELDEYLTYNVGRAARRTFLRRQTPEINGAGTACSSPMPTSADRSVRSSALRSRKLPSCYRPNRLRRRSRQSRQWSLQKRRPTYVPGRRSNRTKPANLPKTKSPK